MRATLLSILVVGAATASAATAQVGVFGAFEPRTAYSSSAGAVLGHSWVLGVTVPVAEAWKLEVSAKLDEFEYGVGLPEQEGRSDHAEVLVQRTLLTRDRWSLGGGLGVRYGIYDRVDFATGVDGVSVPNGHRSTDFWAATAAVTGELAATEHLSLRFDARVAPLDLQGEAPARTAVTAGLAFRF